MDKEHIRTIWLVKEGEALPTDAGDQRLLRMGLIAEEFVRRGCRVLWWTSAFDHNMKTLRAHKTTFVHVKEGYDVCMLMGRPYRRNMSLARVLHYRDEQRSFRREASKLEKPDLILAAMPNIELAQEAVRLGRSMQVPVIVDVRDLWPDLYEELAPRFKGLLHWAIAPFRRQLAWTLQRADAIYATSEKFLAWALGYAGRARRPGDKVYAVAYPDPRDASLVTEGARSFWRDKGLRETDLIACFFGQFGLAVDVEPVIAAARITAKSHPEIKYVLCGKGEKLPQYQAETADLPSVIFPGWTDRPQIAALGEMSSVGLLCYQLNKNFEWSMPNKFCEYLALGLVLMIAPQGMMADKAAAHGCGWRYESAEDLAAQLIRLNEDRAALPELRARSRALYEEEFRADHVYRQLVEEILARAEETPDK